MVQIPDAVSDARVVPSMTAVGAVVAALVVLALVFAGRAVWAGRQAPVPVPTGTMPALVRGSTTLTPAAGSARSSPPAATGSGAAASPVPARSPAAAPSGEAGAVVLVHVVGRVARPGMVRLRPGARVADAVAAAGGATPGADLSAINLARTVVDGEQIRVPRPGEQPTAASSAGAPAVSGPGGAAPAAVSLNTADVAALDTLPGVGPVLAQRIVDWRTEHGRFTSVDELGEVSGIGEKLLAQLRPKVTL